MKHIHLFHNTGGGCRLDDVIVSPCDDSYECECGAKFRTESSKETHFTMPQYIAGKDPSTKSFSQQCTCGEPHISDRVVHRENGLPCYIIDK